MDFFTSNVLKRFSHKTHLRKILNTKKNRICDLLYFIDLMDTTFTQEAFCGLKTGSAGCAGLRSQDSANSLCLSSVCCWYKPLRTLALSASVNVLGNVFVVSEQR